jgi:DNA-binding transcriptional MocR family regulator
MLRHFPDGTRYSRPQGGNVIWVEFPPGVDTLKLHHDALKHRINTAPGALFSVKDRYHHCLRMSCGLPWSDEVEAAVARLGELVRKQR